MDSAESQNRSELPPAIRRRSAANRVRTTVVDRTLPSYHAMKAVLDRFLALAALLVAAPALLVLAWRVRNDSPGPAFFTQTRAGRYAKPFTLFKFRTMRTDVDPYGDSPQTGEDPRITPLGRMLREWSLDELPQLINVAIGEMSLVGPRPLYMQQIAEWDARQRGRLLVKPGLTGLAQINGRGSLTVEQKLEWDVRYVENACLRTDLTIIWRTIGGVFRRSGIYEVQYSASRARRSAAR